MPISAARIYKKSQRGFTLIELLVTLAIIAFMVAIAIPRLGKSLGSQIKSVAQKIAVVNKQMHYMARLKNKTYRLVIDFGDEKTLGRFYVESASGHELIPSASATPVPKGKDGKEPQGPFAPDAQILKKAVNLPQGVKFEDVELMGRDKPITEGKAYIHFFPEGLVQGGIIHISNGKNIHWSLLVDPLTGHTDIQTEYKKLKDFGQ